MADNKATQANQATPPAQTGVDDNRRRTRSQTRNGGITSPPPSVESKGRKRASQSQPGTTGKRGRKPNPEHSKQKNQDLPPADEADKQQPVEEKEDEPAHKSKGEVKQPKMDVDVAENKVEQTKSLSEEKKDERPEQDEKPNSKTNADEDKDKVTKEVSKTKQTYEQKQSEESDQADDHNKLEENKQDEDSKQPEEQKQSEEQRQKEDNKKAEKSASNKEPLKQDDPPKQADTPKPANQEKQPSPKDDKSSDIEPIHKSETKSDGEKATVETNEGGDKDATPAQAIST